MAANPAVKVSTAACGQVMLHWLMAAWHTIMSINVSGCIKYFAEIPIARLHIFMKPLYPPILSNDMQYGDFHKQLLIAIFVKITSQEHFVRIWYYAYVYTYKL